MAEYVGADPGARFGSIDQDPPAQSRQIRQARAEFDKRRGPDFQYTTRLADRKPALDYRK